MRNDFPGYRIAGREARRQSPVSWHRALGQTRSRAKASNRRPPSEPRPAKNARRGSATCKKAAGGPRSPRKRPRTRKGRLAPEGPAASPLRENAGKRPQTKEGDPLGSPSPRRSYRASPPPARATRPGGRRRPTLPQGRPCSTIGAGRLNFRVRYGSGCAPAAVAAGPRGALRRGLRRGGWRSRAPWGPHSAWGKDGLENGRGRRDR